MHVRPTSVRIDMSQTSFPKACHCCKRVHETAAQWSALPLVGHLDDGEELLALRNCVCGSTLAIVVGDSPSRDTIPAPKAA